MSRTRLPLLLLWVAACATAHPAAQRSQPQGRASATAKAPAVETPGRAPAPSHADERLFRSDSGSFTVWLPTHGWTALAEAPNALKLQLKGLPVFLEIDSRYLQPDEDHQSLPVLARSSLDRFRHTLSDSRIAEEGPTVVAGLPGYRIELTGRTGEIPVQILELSTRKGDRLYVIHLSGAEQLLVRGLAAWRRAADSLSARDLAGEVPPEGTPAGTLADDAAKALAQGRDPAKAAALLARAVALRPDDGPLRDRLVEADLAAGEIGHALRALAAEVARSPDRFDRLELLGALELQVGDAAAAVRDWEAATSRAGCPAEIFKSLGALLLAERRLPEAEVAFQGAIQRAPKDAAAFAGLGEAYLKAKELDRAREAEERAAKLDPGQGEVHAILSEIYGEQNRYRSASTECMAALQREIPKKLSATLKYNLACYQAKLGHERECLWWLRQALESGFDDLNLLKTDPDLTSVRSTPAFQELLAP